ncbi:TlpA family protein disulfide reductase [Terrimonas sp.]|uniref:TlpA family protein disulfide reductase n=1 Tax=Terrimonas sp. TaxID=1914338 RepID=UPI00105712B9|nr:TlpA disulfide reductase family protein [Terrimonas sp.]
MKATLLLVFLFLTSTKSFCQKAFSSVSYPKIVLIFDSLPQYHNVIYPLPDLTVNDSHKQVTIFDNFYEYGYNPLPLVKDTLTYLPKNQFIILSFRYDLTASTIDYLINSGDTLTISFFNGLPYAKSRSLYSTSFLNYEVQRRGLTENNINNNAYDIYYHPFLVAKDLNDLINNVKKIKDDWYERAHRYIINELSHLEKYRATNEVFTPPLLFLQDKFTYQLAKLEFEKHKLPVDSLTGFLARNKNDTLNFPYSYFLVFLEAISDSVNVMQSKILYSANKNQIDYRDVYERTSKWSAINDFYKKLLLFKYLKQIGDVFSTSDLQKYLAKFKKFSNDTLLVNQIKREYLIVEDLVSKGSDSLVLINEKSQSLTFRSLLEMNKGKVIYIDFWASWCIPCRREMKMAKQLRNDFENQDIAFVYISLDKSRSDWMEAVNVDGINTLEHNYILKKSSSSFLQSIKLESIPRYLLFDKQGTLVHKNAPEPSSNEVVELLKKYLGK